MSLLTVTLKKSLNGARKPQRRAALCLGLKRIHQSRSFKDSPALRGQIRAIKHLVSVTKTEAPSRLKERK